MLKVDSDPVAPGSSFLKNAFPLTDPQQSYPTLLSFISSHVLMCCLSHIQKKLKEIQIL